MISMNKSYSELIKIPSFIERFRYLRLAGIVGSSTFGYDRYLNQMLYRSKLWRKTRDVIIIRDEGLDLGFPGYEINNTIYIHHINPITKEDIESASSIIFSYENLICVSSETHLAIHYGDENLLFKAPVVRYPGDTTLWNIEERIGKHG